MGADARGVSVVSMAQGGRRRSWRRRRITDIEGPLHRRTLGEHDPPASGTLSLTDVEALNRADGRIRALVVEALMDDDPGLGAVVDRLARWVARTAHRGGEDIARHIAVTHATFKPAYRVELVVRRGAAEPSEAGAVQLVAHPDVPQAVRAGEVLPGSAEACREGDVGSPPPSSSPSGAPVAAPMLADGSLLGPRSRETHPDLPELEADGLRSGPAALFADTDPVPLGPGPLDEEPGEVLFEVPARGEAIDRLIDVLSHEPLRQAVKELRAVATAGDEAEGREWVCVSAIPVTEIHYVFDGRPFTLWVYGFGERMWADEEPVSAGMLGGEEPAGRAAASGQSVGGVGSVASAEEPAPVGRRDGVSLPIRQRPPDGPRVILSSAVSRLAREAGRERPTAKALPRVAGSGWREDPRTEIARMPAPDTEVTLLPGPVTGVMRVGPDARPPRRQTTWLVLGALLGLCLLAALLASLWWVWLAPGALRSGLSAPSVAGPVSPAAARKAAPPEEEPRAPLDGPTRAAPPSKAETAVAALGPRAASRAAEPDPAPSTSPRAGGGEQPPNAAHAAEEGRGGEVDRAPAPDAPAAAVASPTVESLPRQPPPLGGDGATHEVTGTSADVEAPWLALRAGPRARSRLLATMPDGTRVRRLRKGRRWWKVLVLTGQGAGETGWANRRWLRPVR